MDSVLHPTAIVLPGVKIGAQANIGAYTIIGELARDYDPNLAKTIIGELAVIRSHTVIYAGNIIGKKFQTGHGVLIRENNTIGDNVSIGSHSIMEHHVQIENGVRIHSNAFIPEFSVLGEQCWIGPCVIVTNARYPQSPKAKRNLLGVRIEPHARIGAGAVLLPGIQIGAYALIGAGAVVTKNVPEGAVVAGNPARIINSTQNIPDYDR